MTNRGQRVKTSLPSALRNPAGPSPSCPRRSHTHQCTRVYGRPSLLGLTFPLLCCASRDHLPKKPLALKFLSQVYFWGKRTHNTSYPRLPRAPLSERIRAAHERPVHGTLAPWYTAVLCSPVPQPGFQYAVLHRRSGKCSPCPR